MQISTRLRWRNAMSYKRRFRIERSDSLNLPVLSLLCAWARRLKTRTQRSQAIYTCCPLLKLLLIKTSIILTPCTSTQRKLENEQRKSYQILISSCWTTEIRLFDFCRKRGLGPDQSHYNQSRLGSRLQSTLAQITRITPKWIYTVHCIENFFTVHDFWATCACPKKNRVARKFFTVLNILFRSGFLTTCACPENRVCPEIFHCIEYIFYYSEILSNLRLRWKTECALNSLYWIYIFYYSRFLSNLRLPWKTECALKFFTALDMCFLSFRIFEQLALVLKNRVALEFFTVLRYF